jgi:hypothetical protein
MAEYEKMDVNHALAFSWNIPPLLGKLRKVG